MPTPDLVDPLPAGFRNFGSELLGLQVPVPETWIDATAALRESDAFDRFGPRLLLLVDSAETSSGLFSGSLSNHGAFIFGFIDDSPAPAAQPEAVLAALSATKEGEGDLTTDFITVVAGDASGVYADFSADLLNLFPPLDQAMRYRVVVLFEPDTGLLATFLMGSSAGSWEASADLFAVVLEAIKLPESKTNVYEQLGSGDLANGKLESGASDIWTFNASSDRYATITLTPNDENIDLTLKLHDPNGNILANVDNGYAGESEVLSDVSLPENGTYFIEAGEFFKEEGLYQLSLLLLEKPQLGGGGRIEFAQEVNSELAVGSEHLWVFDGTAGQDISIVLTSLNDRLDVILELLGPDGRDLVIMDEGLAGDGELLAGFELYDTGEYVIVVRGFTGHSGPYSLYLEEGGESTINYYDAGDLVYGGNAREFLREDEAHAWFFDGTAGDEVTIEVLPSKPNMDMDIWLLDSDLNELAIRDEFLSGEPEKIEETLPANGQYLVLVREFFGEPGEYEILFNASEQVDTLEIAGTLQYDQTISSMLLPGRQEGWTFNGKADDVVNVTATSSDPEHDLVISLVAPDGNTIVKADAASSGFTERITAFQLPSGGKWMILVQEFFNEGGGYELTLTQEGS